MKNKLFAFLKRHHIHLDQNILSYVICVIIAAVLWFLNALNKDYIAEVSYPVKYTNLPKGKHLISELPQNIILEVQAKGFALLGYRVSTSFLPITFNVNSYTNHLLERNEILEYTINTSDIKEKINSQLNSDIKLLSITPAAIDFKFSYSVTKNIAVSPVVHYTLKRQYILKNGITTTPDSILVSGPSTVMDTLQAIYTEPFTLKDLDEDITKKVDLVPTEEVSFEEQKIQVNVRVERFTEAKRKIPLTVTNLPDSLNIRLFPNYIDVTYDVGLSMYDKVFDNDFIFSIDYQPDMNRTMLNVKVVKVPSFIDNLTFTPQKVEYILEKVKTKN